MKIGLLYIIIMKNEKMNLKNNIVFNWKNIKNSYHIIKEKILLNIEKILEEKIILILR